MSQDLVDKQESAMEGRGKSIPGSAKGRCQGPEAGACLVRWRIQKAGRAEAGQARGRGKVDGVREVGLGQVRQALFFAVAGP